VGEYPEHLGCQPSSSLRGSIVAYQYEEPSNSRGAGFQRRALLHSLRCLLSAKAWHQRWASTRIQGTTKRQVREMFTEERSALLPLPSRRFEYFRDGERRVHFDDHIGVDGAYYSVPPRHVGTKVVVHT
jgi:hypothetical protein